MKVLVLTIVCFYASYGISNAAQKGPYFEEWLEVPVDHFNLFDNRTWKMRYIASNKFYEEGGPLIVEIGGEWTVGYWSLFYSQIRTLAQKHKAFLVASEHRYYGKSLPFSTNFTTENFKYLQVEQALEDLAFLIDHLKSSTPGLANSTVVIHGCSYAGMLASWFRLRFPHLADIAYASSPPVGVTIDYADYYEVVHDVYANISSTCVETIRRSIKMAETLLDTEDGTKHVKDALRGWDCGDIEEMGPRKIIEKITDVLNIQFDAHHFEDITCLELSMDTDDTSAFGRVANLVVLKSKIDCGQNTPMTKQDEISWTYQICTELGFFQSLNKQNPRNPFGINKPLEEDLATCREKLGEGVTLGLLQTGVERTNRRYGGRNIRISKLLTVQGSHDPWIRGGLVKESSPETPVIILDGSHCVDVADRSDDPEELSKGREKIRDIISKWIEQLSSKH